MLASLASASARVCLACVVRVLCLRLDRFRFERSVKNVDTGGLTIADAEYHWDDPFGLHMHAAELCVRPAVAALPHA